RAVATAWHERTSAEWPPHPQRLYSALVATHFELGLGKDSEAALLWLESLPPPEIRATGTPWLRDTLSHWVPVNDEAVKHEKEKSDPRHPLERRNRQERHFPTVGLDDAIVTFQWPEADGAEEYRPALRTLVESLTYLGHSSSPVRACLREEPVEPTFKPAPEGDVPLRIPGRGRFARLCSTHALRLDDESVQPPLGRTQMYTSRQCAPASVFSADAIVLAFDGPRLGLDSTLPLMQHLRAAV